MGTLGQYLRGAREGKDIDLRDAAQQTRISINYLKALEEENFSKLPGEVFVKGFLKNYGRFLSLDEAEIMKRYAELQPKAPLPAAASPDAEKAAVPPEREPRRETPVEPFVWGAVIFIALLVFLFTSLPSRHAKNGRQVAPSAVPTPEPQDAAQAPSQSKPEQTEKLYLEVVAVEDTWLLVRIDSSPQKKAVLKKGESLIWSADERFLLSYGRVGAVKLLLNGEELVVRGTKETLVRDLSITRTGIVNQPAPPISAKPKPKPKPQPAAQPAQAQPQSPSPMTQAEQKPAAPAPAPVLPSPEPAQGSPLTPSTPAQ